MLYPIAVEKGSETEAYGVTVPDIKGCFSAGDTFEEALNNVKEAIAGHLEILAEDGSIGIRLVKDDFCKKLISKLNKPLVSTSANFSGDKSPLKFSDISQELIDAVDYAVEENRELVSKYSGSSVIKVWSDGRVKVLRE